MAYKQGDLRRIDDIESRYGNVERAQKNLLTAIRRGDAESAETWSRRLTRRTGELTELLVEQREKAAVVVASLEGGLK